MHRSGHEGPVRDRHIADRASTILSVANELIDDLGSLTERIASVAAPTGNEGERSLLVANYFRAARLAVHVDDLGDVVAVLPGLGPGPAVLLAAHLDTVFPIGTALSITRSDGRITGPGVGDNSLGVAALMLMPALLERTGIRPAVDVLLAADVGEEGLGNLRGMHAVMDAWPATGAVVAIEGHNLGRLTHVAVGSRRIRLTATGPGGHSWGDAGRPSAIHALARVVSQLSGLSLSRTPKTSLNVGTFEGGVSVNTIAPIATCVIDLRSVDDASLGALVARVQHIVETESRAGITISTEVLGDRPAGIVPLDSAIVRDATAVLEALGLEATFDASSTDANVPISRGIPAVCIGLSHGGNVHREDEYVELGPAATGLAQLGLLTIALADHLGGS